jgi:lysyl-tRNA synthetase class 2
VAGDSIPWRPSSGYSTAQRRAYMLSAARQYFAAQEILEVETPALSRHAVSDPQIESVGSTLLVDPANEYFLRTSPEFAMKRLLCAGYPDIYEICKVFRDGEVGRRHQPEFTMIEWYRRNFGLQEIIGDTIALIATLLNAEQLTADPVQLSYDEAFQGFVGLNPREALIDDLATAAKADASLCNSVGMNRDDWLNLILSNEVSTQFADDRLTVLYHYPASQAALARICPDNESVADRFEVFLGSLELANGYVELTDAAEQRRRFADDQRLRKELGRKTRPLDEQLLAALENGLPECAGVAVGFDRLLMINEGRDDIRAVQSIAFKE